MSTLKGPITLEDAARFIASAYSGYSLSRGVYSTNTETSFLNAKTLSDFWLYRCVNSLPQQLRNYHGTERIVGLLKKYPENFAVITRLKGEKTLFDENGRTLIETIGYNKTALEDMVTGQTFKSGVSEFGFDCLSHRQFLDIFNFDGENASRFYSFLDKKIIEAQARINSQLAAAAVNIVKFID